MQSIPYFPAPKQSNPSYNFTLYSFIISPSCNDTLTFLLDKIPVRLFLFSKGFTDLAASSALFILGTALGLSNNLRFPGKFIDSKK